MINIRKIILYFILLFPFGGCWEVAHADEGMWTLFNLPDVVYEQMREEGFTLPRTWLYDDSLGCSAHSDTCGEKRSMKATAASAVVNFSGFCTGVVVSPSGLVMTNHHCGFDAIRNLSTVENNYLRDGFCAEELADELPAENTFVAFMRRQEDITPLLDSLGIKDMTSFDQGALIDSLEEDMTERVKGIDSTYYVEITPFFEGNAYYATTYQSYPDVRLVFTPSKSMGKFGGETDNWMWPRQTCDFSVFRIYADPDSGAPAPYSKDNKPLQSKHYIPISTNGYREGDFAMTIGYPGSTERYLSSYGIEEMRNCKNAPTWQVRGVKQQVMKRHMEASEAVRIKYDAKYASSCNYWKNAIGMNKCIDSIGIIGIKRQMEAILDTLHYPGLDLGKLKKYYEERAVAQHTYTMFRESFMRQSNNELARRAHRYFNGMPVHGPVKHPRRQYTMFDDNSDTWDKALDIDVMAALMRNYREQLKPEALKAGYLPTFYKRVDEQYQGDYHKYVEDIFNNSILFKKGARIPVLTTRKLKKDIGIEFSTSLMETLADLKMVIDPPLSDSIDTQERLLCAAKLQIEEGLPHYSDANFTMRVSYGQVGGYSIAGYNSGYYTTAQSLSEKMLLGGDNSDYYVEPHIRAMIDTKKYGIFTDAVSNTLNLCFLTNNDITGGNSGSPVINGNGQLIGLAFDGNWDSLADDIRFDNSLARTICVDIRYILFFMKQWNGSQRLLYEMGIED